MPPSAAPVPAGHGGGGGNGGGGKAGGGTDGGGIDGGGRAGGGFGGGGVGGGIGGGGDGGGGDGDGGVGGGGDGGGAGGGGELRTYAVRPGLPDSRFSSDLSQHWPAYSTKPVHNASVRHMAQQSSTGTGSWMTVVGDRVGAPSP